MRNPTSVPIVLRLLRKNKDADCDDVIKIRPVEDSEDEYTIEYKCGDSENPDSPIRHTSLVSLSGEEVDTYLGSLFVLLSRDDDPFEKLQILAPGFPSIMLTMDELRKQRARQAIMDVLPLLTNFWRT